MDFGYDQLEKAAVTINYPVMKFKIYFVLFLIPIYGFAQFPLDKDSVNKIISRMPAFSIYKDNYFVTGAPIGKVPSRDNADAKFQFSFKQRLSDNPFAFGAYAYLTYTQKSFWDIYKASSPFAETNYNPAVILLKPVFRENRFFGVTTFGIEHESNGRDSIYSRSWNFASLGFTRIYSHNLSFGLKLWVPFMISNNPGLPKYIGYGEAQLQWISNDNRWFIDVLVRKGADWNFKGSFNAGLSFRPGKKSNQLLTLQWFQGYSESLIDYQSDRSVLRVGFVLKPTYYRFY